MWMGYLLSYCCLLDFWIFQFFDFSIFRFSIFDFRFLMCVACAVCLCYIYTHMSVCARVCMSGCVRACVS